MSEQELLTFNENLNALRRKVYESHIVRTPLENLYKRIDAEFIRLANALEKEKGSPKSYHLIRVDFSKLPLGWVTVSAKDGFTIRLYTMHKARLRNWVNLPESQKGYKHRTFTRNKQYHEIVEEANKVLEHR